MPGCQVLGLAVGVSAGVPGSCVSGRGHCRVAAFGLSGLRELDVFFITVSHCAWRHVISWSLATKKRSKENAFRMRAHKLTQRAVSTFLAPQKHGARQNHGCVNPSFSEHGYPHASPPVTEPAHGSPRAIRGQPPIEFVRMPNHVANPPRNTAARWVRPYPQNCGADQATSRSRREAIK